MPAVMTAAPGLDTLPPAPRVVVDVSEWQGNIDWRQMADHGVTDVYIKATRGIDYIDPRFLQNVMLAGLYDIRWGCYHYFMHHQSGAGQASWFMSKAAASLFGDLPPALDVEAGMQSAPPNAMQLKKWLDLVEDVAGVKPVIYTSWGYWNQTTFGHSVEWANEYPLWVAHYTTADKPLIPADWDDWWLWQYGQTAGKPFGVPTSACGGSMQIDVNRFNDNAA